MPYAARIKGKNAKLSLLQFTVWILNIHFPLNLFPPEVKWTIATKDWNVQEKRNKGWICEYHVTYTVCLTRQGGVALTLFIYQANISAPAHHFPKKEFYTLVR